MVLARSGPVRGLPVSYFDSGLAFLNSGTDQIRLVCEGALVRGPQRHRRR